MHRTTHSLLGIIGPRRPEARACDLSRWKLNLVALGHRTRQQACGKSYQIWGEYYLKFWKTRTLWIENSHDIFYWWLDLYRLLRRTKYKYYLLGHPKIGVNFSVTNIWLHVGIKTHSGIYTCPAPNSTGAYSSIWQVASDSQDYQVRASIDIPVSESSNPTTQNQSLNIGFKSLSATIFGIIEIRGVTLWLQSEFLWVSRWI